jgi:hypothetical protein
MDLTLFLVVDSSPAFVNDCFDKVDEDGGVA